MNQKKEQSLVEKKDVKRSEKIIDTLQGLMTEVTKKNCDAGTVNAACNCADKITDILKVQLEYMRFEKAFKNKDY